MTLTTKALALLLGGCQSPEYRCIDGKLYQHMSSQDIWIRSEQFYYFYTDCVTTPEAPTR